MEILTLAQRKNNHTDAICFRCFESDFKWYFQWTFKKIKNVGKIKNVKNVKNVPWINNVKTFFTSMAGPARARHVWGGAAGHLPVSRHRQAALCIKYLDWVHQSDWPTASRRFPTSQHPQRLLLARHSYICRTMCHCRWTLFNNICHNQNHVLYSILPPPSTASRNYHLRLRAHSQQLLQHTGHLTDSNFITRMLFTGIY